MVTRVSLRRMTAEEFAHFADSSARDYAEGLIKSGIPREQARRQALEEFMGQLPGGVETPDHFLMTLLDAPSGRPVGALWYLYEWTAGTRQVFLNDLLILASERRKGYASAALLEMERRAGIDGCGESVVFVWAHNFPGLSLYRKCGYTVIRETNGGAYLKKALAHADAVQAGSMGGFPG